MADPQFVNGLMIKKPHDNAPDFVKCAMSMKRLDLIAWLTSKDDDWINVQIKEAKTTKKWYAEVDTWKPNKEDAPKTIAEKKADGSFNDDDLPF